MNLDHLLFIGIIIATSMLAINIVYGQQPEVKDRYQLECGMKLLITPDEYIRVMNEEWNYNPDSMPPHLKAQYDCVTRIHAEDQLGFKDSGNIDDNLYNNQEDTPQSRADQILKELGKSMLRD